MDESARFPAVVRDRRRHCEVLARAYGFWLAALLPANLVLVAGAAVLSLIAGAAVLVENHVISAQQAGYLALLSAAFTIVHNRLGCDAHQSECKKLRAAYESLAVKYQALEILGDTEAVRQQIAALDSRLAAIKEASTARPPPRLLSKAEERVPRA